MTGRYSTKGLRRAPVPATHGDAVYRETRICLCIASLKDARAYARFTPATRAAIDRAIKSAGGALRHASAVAARMRVWPVFLLLALVGACSPTRPAPMPTPVSGVFTVTSSDRDAYALVGATYRLNATGAVVQFADGAGPVTIDSQDGDLRHVEAQRISVPASWRTLEPLVFGLQCDLWTDRRVGYCQLGIADAHGTATVQGEVRF